MKNTCTSYIKVGYSKRIVTIPKSVTPSRIKENFTISDFALTEEEIRQINTLNRDLHVGTNLINMIRYKKTVS